MKFLKTFFKLSALSLASILLLATPAHAAGTASFSISGSGNYTVGSTFTVAITENSGALEINSVEADLQYDPSLLQVTGLHVGDFATCPVAPASSGTRITFSCAALGSKLTGTHVVGSVDLKALGNGTAALSILSSSAIVDANSNQNDWDGALSSASYGLSTPAPAPSPSPSPTPTPTTSTSSHSTSTKSTPSSTGASTSSTTQVSPSTSGDVLGDTTQPNSSNKIQPQHPSTTTAQHGSSLLGYWILIGILAAIALAWAWILRSRQVLPVKADTKKNATASKKKPAKRTKK